MHHPALITNLFVCVCVCLFSGSVFLVWSSNPEKSSVAVVWCSVLLSKL